MVLISLSQIKGGTELKSAVEKIKGRIFITDPYVPTAAQTVFTLSQIANSEPLTLHVNGISYAEGKGYFTVDRAGKSLTWTFTEAKGGFDMESGDEVSAHYETDKLVNPVTLKAAPALVADSTDNYATQVIDITFADDADWRSAITSVKLNGISTQSFSVQSGKISMLVGAFHGTGSYTIAVEANGYTLASLNQQILPTPAPVLTADTTENRLGKDIIVSYPASPEWSSKVTGVRWGSTSLTAAQFDKTVSGEIKFPASTLALFGAGTHTISVFATGYSVATVSQVVLDEAQAPSDLEIVWTQTPSMYGNYTLTGTPLSVEKVYGPAFDGEGRTASLFFFNGTSYVPVPLKDFDTFPAPQGSAGAWWFDDTSGKQIISFESFGIGDLAFKIVYKP